MHLHILGICGTFMGGIAVLARKAGHTVTGCDANVYPPMSTQLEAQGIALYEGFDAEQLDKYKANLYVVGNAMTRGKPVIEEMLNRGLPYVSGPQWLGENFLRNKWVLAVAGTHGKTTTSAMLAWILEHAGLSPGFLIGGVPANFGVSARAPGGDSPFFVIEADEYDTAFFDKRSKFVHYRPRTAVLNNLEFDHADIFDDLAAIERQFHHLVRTVPPSGRVVFNGLEESLARVLHAGCWSEVRSFGAAVSDYQAVERDFAFVVTDSVPAADLVKAAAGADKALFASPEMKRILGQSQTLAKYLSCRAITLGDITRCDFIDEVDTRTECREHFDRYRSLKDARNGKSWLFTDEDYRLCKAQPMADACDGFREMARTGDPGRCPKGDYEAFCRALFNLDRSQCRGSGPYAKNIEKICGQAIDDKQRSQAGLDSISKTGNLVDQMYARAALGDQKACEDFALKLSDTCVTILDKSDRPALPPAPAK